MTELSSGTRGPGAPQEPHLSGWAVAGLCWPARCPSRTGSPIPCSGSYRRQEIKHGGGSQAGSEPRRSLQGLVWDGEAGPSPPHAVLGSGWGLPAAASRVQAARGGGTCAFISHASSDARRILHPTARGAITPAPQGFQFTCQPLVKRFRLGPGEEGTGFPTETSPLTLRQRNRVYPRG